MLTKKEIINKVTELVREACYGWSVRDGWASHELIEAEQKRIRQDGDDVIEYLKNHD